jgi:acetolactate synthase-1/2/3 large subunit
MAHAPNKGGTALVDGIKLTLTDANHSSSGPDGQYLGEPAGIVLELEDGLTIYFAGDTNVFASMQLIGRIYEPDVAVLPIGDHFTMGPREAAVALELLGVTRCVPCHYGTFPLLTGTPDELRRLAELSGIPVVTTLMARGAFPDSHQQHLGMPGMHGSVSAVTALQKADLLIALGTRFDDRVTGKLDTFAPNATVIHADIDPAEIGKNRVAEVPIVGDVREVLLELIPAVEAQFEAGNRADLTGWWRQLDQWRETYPLGYAEPADGTLAPQYVIERLGKIAGPETIFAAGVGQHQMWAAQFISYENPYTWLNSGGLGTMGYAVPAAMGAKVACPDKLVWAIDGDGCFQMTNQELATCAIEGIPIKVAVINNGNLGMVRQWQTLFYDERYSQTELGTHAMASANVAGAKRRIPDFVKLAEALGCAGLRCETKSDVDETLKKAMAIDDTPVVVDFTVGKDAMVWPMVASGASNDEIQAARDIRPTFEGDE